MTLPSLPLGSDRIGFYVEYRSKTDPTWGGYIGYVEGQRMGLTSKFKGNLTPFPTFELAQARAEANNRGNHIAWVVPE